MERTSIYVARDNEITLIKRFGADESDFSLGTAYNYFTKWLGFKTYHDAGKVMALAAYGKGQHQCVYVYNLDSEVTNMAIKTKMVDGIKFSYLNEDEFRHIYEDIFMGHVCQFATNTSTPIIIDCGAHIGVSVLYFKKMYPQAEIIAFEPHPVTFKLFELNVKQNDLRNVKLVNAAVADFNTEIDFYASEERVTGWMTWPCASAGVKNAWYNPSIYKTIKVPAVKLSSYLDRNIDFLKLDIEGMEEIVLKEIEQKLWLINELRIDFHGSTTNEQNDLERIFGILKRNGLGYAVTQKREGIKKRIKISQIRREDPYWVTIFTSRCPENLWGTASLGGG